MKAPVNCYQGLAPALLLTILITSLPASVASESDTALQLIDRMGQASRSLNYEGVFVYLRNSQLKAVRVIHKADESGEYERLVSLNGAPREIIRNNELVTCIFPDEKAVLMDERRYSSHKKAVREKNFHDKSAFPWRLPTKVKAMHEHYRFSLGEAERIVGRKTQQIIIVPKDQYRYGYRLWVDSKTGLLLKTVMIGENNRALEQVMFTSLSLPEKISSADLMPAVTGREFSWREDEPLNIDGGDYESQWQVGWIPAGFTLVAHGKHLLPNSQVPVEHLAYSDGLGSVSIFIERIIRAHQSHLRGFSNMGAVNAYGTTQALHYLTVVGDVPHTTVERIGKSIRYIGADTD
jgi:sigma-E factor negative regulatory protein RseB